ncbi:MAG: ATP-binding protein, partial [Haloechinothrix sp.]
MIFTSVDYDKFRALRVTHVATRFEELIGEEANDALTPEQLFLTAVDDALEARRVHKIEKLIRHAGFPIMDATVAEIDYRDGRGVTPVRMKRYAAHDWRADPTNLLIISATGGGKTYLASALGIAACHNEHTVTYLRMDDLARQLVLARADAIAHQQTLNELSNVDLLILDDFLTIGIDSDAASDLFAILANREHRLPTIIASQTGPVHWVAELPDRGRRGLDREPAREPRPHDHPRRHRHAQTPSRPDARAHHLLGVTGASGPALAGRGRYHAQGPLTPVRYRFSEPRGQYHLPRAPVPSPWTRGTVRGYAPCTPVAVLAAAVEAPQLGMAVASAG